MVRLEKIKNWLFGEEMEHMLLLITLIIAIPYFIVSIIFDLTKGEPTIYLIIDSSFLIICIAFSFLSKIKEFRSMLISIFCALITVGFVFFWQISGGIKGGASYIFFVLSVLLIFMNKGFFRTFYTCACVALVFVLTSDLITPTGEITYSGLLFDFILNLIILATLLLVFKLALDKEQQELELQNNQISELNEKLKIKSEELEDYNKQIDALKNNLQHIVDKRTQTLEHENKKDIEFAFINAHLVRAPIANILAITQYFQKGDEKLIELEKNALALDAAVRKIGKVLAE